MTVEEALEFLDRAVSAARLTRSEHAHAVRAIKFLEKEFAEKQDDEEE